MTEEIKKCYDFLNLPYDASLNDLKEKEHNLIESYKLDTVKTGNTHTEDIAFVKIASDKLYEFITDKDESKCHFDTKPADLSTLIFVLVMLCSAVWLLICAII